MTETAAPILSMRGVAKNFGLQTALQGVDFELARGEVHGLVGGNGAGKTTLMNILYGMYRMDHGELKIDGRPATIRSPAEALRLGIGMVHQHFLQVPGLSVLENIVLGTTVSRPLTMDLTVEARTISRLADQFGLALDLNEPIEGLPVGVRQKVEILKALYRDVRILILDEPTTNLTPQEADQLFSTLRQLVSRGLSIVFITHKLKEARRACDRITVLNEGRQVVTLPGTTDQETIVRAMVGDRLDPGKSVLFTGSRGDETDRVSPKEVVLALDRVFVTGEGPIDRLVDISFEVRSGEIVGVAGVARNGQGELADAIVGLETPRSGTVLFNGHNAGHNAGLLTIAQRFQNGLAYVPDDRIRDGFLPTADVISNLILGSQDRPPLSRAGFLCWRKITDTARGLIDRFHITVADLSQPAGDLSGGNIQKLILARAFARQARLLVAHNPVRGLDLAAIEHVYQELLALKRMGSATLLLSENLDELMLLSDRILVLYGGRIAGTAARGAFDRYELGRLMSGAGPTV